MGRFNNDISHRLRLQHEDIERRRSAVKINGIPALQRLMEIAQGGTGQARIVGRFLLGIYNNDAFPFPLADLRGLILPNGPLVFNRMLSIWGRV